MRSGAAALALALLAGCGSGDGGDRPPRHDPSATPRIVGPGPRWRPPSISAAVRAARPVLGRLHCRSSGPARFGAHLELFAARRVLVVPAGIGVAPPRRRRGAYVEGGRCSYPLRTREPTGVVEVERDRPFTLGDMFAIWGQPLSPRRLAGFRGPVEAYVGGVRWHADPRSIPLRRHAQIVLEVGGHVPPHARYGFQPGL